MATGKKKGKESEAGEPRNSSVVVVGEGGGMNEAEIGRAHV